MSLPSGPRSSWPGTKAQNPRPTGGPEPRDGEEKSESRVDQSKVDRLRKLRVTTVCLCAPQLGVVVGPALTSPQVDGAVWCETTLLTDTSKPPAEHEDPLQLRATLGGLLSGAPETSTETINRGFPSASRGAVAGMGAPPFATYAKVRVVCPDLDAVNASNRSRYPADEGNGSG